MNRIDTETLQRRESAPVQILITESEYYFLTKIWARLWYWYLLRESCFDCKYHSLKRPGNITIGDYWGIEKVISEFKDDWGVPCLLVNDERGLALLDKAKDSFELRKTLVEEVANEEQPMLYKQPEKNWQKKFGGEYRKAGFEKACKKVGVLGWKESLRNGAKPWMKLYGVWAPSILKALWARRCNRLNLT